METTLRHRLTAVPLLLAATLTLAACSGGGDADETMSRKSVEEPAAVARDALTDSDEMAYRAPNTTAGLAGSDEAEAATDRSVISTGVVSLLGDDVERARFDVQKIVDARGGEVAEEKTQTDDDGEVSRSRLVIRIPVADFDDTMEELEGVARLESSSRNSEDVTTEVIDTEVRIRAQSESLKRVEILLSRARSIRDIVAIEAQLTRRQAELDSLKARQAYLDDQTSMSTITVFLAQTPEKEKAEKKDETGFLAGLSSGWHGLKTFLVGAATVLGAVLPFSVLFLVLGIPAWLLLRSLARRRPPRAAPAGAVQE